MTPEIAPHIAPDIAIIGTGAWGSALASLYTTAGHRIARVARNDPVPADAAITLLCPPFQHLRATLARLTPTGGPLVLCCKGLERETALLGPEIIADCGLARPAALLTGPNFAVEITAGHPAAAILAAADPNIRRALLETLSTPGFRLYGSADIIGAALGGAAKNVIAIAAGIVIGAGLGENARAALITRGLAEIARLAAAIGGSGETIAGLAGLGDLVLTATSPASRNYRAGLAIGRGHRPDPASGVIEGIATAPALLARAAAAGCTMPITDAVVALLDRRASVAESLASLMRRDLRDET